MAAYAQNLPRLYLDCAADGGVRAFLHRPVCPHSAALLSARQRALGAVCGAGKLYGGHRQRGVRAGFRQFHAVPRRGRAAYYAGFLPDRAAFAASGGPAQAA